MQHACPLVPINHGKQPLRPCEKYVVLTLQVGGEMDSNFLVLLLSCSLLAAHVLDIKCPTNPFVPTSFGRGAESMLELAEKTASTRRVWR